MTEARDAGAKAMVVSTTADHHLWLERMLLDGRERWVRLEAHEAALATLRAEHDRLTDQLAGMVAPEELRQWKAECERLRAEIAWRKGETAKLRLDLEDRESQVQALQQALESIQSEILLSSVQPFVLRQIETIVRAALALPGEAAQQPAGSFGYCAICYHPLDRCSHCDAGEAAQEK